MASSHGGGLDQPCWCQVSDNKSYFHDEGTELEADSDQLLEELQGKDPKAWFVDGSLMVNSSVKDGERCR